MPNRNESSGCWNHRIRGLRTALVGARRPVPEPPDRLRGELEPERRDPDALARAPRDRIAAPVGRRDLLPGVRGLALHDGRARRPLRTEGRAAARPRAVPRRCRARDRVHRDVAADRQPCGHGRRRRADHAVDVVDHHQHLPAVRATEGDRDLGERHRRGGRARSGCERLPARALLVRISVPREHPDHHRGARRRKVLRSEVS